jgi:dolichyl-phosphate beta-glucosyltransferase
MTNSTPFFLSIIFPAHNEELRLPETLNKALVFVNTQPFPVEIIIVENASVDSTLKIANEFAKIHPNTTVIHEDCPGKGLAVKTGMLAAKGKYRFVCDVDLSMPITEIVRFLPPLLMDVDVAIASREAPGAIRYDEPLYRHLIGRIFNNMVRWLTLPNLQDTQCGFKCFSAEAAEALFPLQTMNGWTFDVEILAMAIQMGYRVTEVPIHWYYQPQSKVHIFRDSFHMAMDLLKIRRNIRARRYAAKN